MLGHHHSDDVPMSYVQDESFDEGISFTRIPSGSGGGGDGEQDVQRLWKLLEKKDADLQKAARLGKMLLDEKEEDAEAHEGEKEALWRRIQDMARRVMELEQEASELRKIADARQDTSSPTIDPASMPPNISDESVTAAVSAALNASFGSNNGVGVTGRGAEERALRAKNEMLERQLQHMKDEAEEARLELEAARKARFGRRQHFRAPAGAYSPVRQVKSRADSIVSSHGNVSPTSTTRDTPRRATPRHKQQQQQQQQQQQPETQPQQQRAKQSHRRRSSSGRGLEAWFVSPNPNVDGSSGEEDDDGQGPARHGGERSGSDLEEREELGDDGLGERPEEPRLQNTNSWGEVPNSSDEDHQAGIAARRPRRVSRTEDGGGGADSDGDDVAYLMEHNAWLLEQLEAKDELIEALRAQVEELELGGGVGGRRRSSIPGVLSFGAGGCRERGEGGGEIGVLGRGLGLGLELDCSDDDSDDDEDEDDEDVDIRRRSGRRSFGRAGERSFLDELMDGGREETDEEEAFMSVDRHYAAGNRFPPRDAMMSKVEEEDDDTHHEAGRRTGTPRGGGRHFGDPLADNALPAQRVREDPPSKAGALAPSSPTSNKPLRADPGKSTPMKTSAAQVTTTPMPAGNMPVQESEHSEEVSTEPCSPDEQSLSPPLNTTTAKTAPFLVGRPAEPAAIPAPTTAAPAASGAAPTCTVPRSSGKKRDDDDVPMDDAPGGDVSSSPGVTDTVRLASVCVGDGAEKEDARASLAAPATAIAAAAEPCTADDVDAERHRKDDSFTEMLEGRSGPVGAGEKNGSFPAGRVTPSAGRLHVDKRYAVEDVYSLGGGRLDGSPEGAVGGRGNREAEEEEDYYDEIPVHPTPNRAERKSRQAMNKLGLRAVPGGVYRMEMKMSHGVVFVVKNPDVFKHPRRNTYVVFGTAETEMSPSSGMGAGYSNYSHHNHYRGRGRDSVHRHHRRASRSPTFSSSAADERSRTSSEAAAADAAAAITGAGPPLHQTSLTPQQATNRAKLSQRPDPAAVEAKSVRAGLDPTDVLTIVSHAGCSPDEAIVALKQNDGDVVNAVLALT